MEASFEEIARTLQNADRILVASHLRPDADALGSTLACALWLKFLGKNVTAWNEDGMIGKFRYLPGQEILSAPPNEPQEFDVLLAVDTSVKNRLGTVLTAIKGDPLIINIDHHVSNERFGNLNHVDPSAPATGQILYDFISGTGATVSSDIAENLFAAISTDTGSFQYAGTSEHTFEVGAALIRAGVNVSELSRSMYESQSRRRFDLLRHALNVTNFSCGDRLASFTLTLEKARELEVLPEDNEGIIDHLRSVDGVLAAVFFEELPEGRVRVSARSKDPRVDVCRICQKFGGGGHPMASGARIKGPIAEVETTFLKAVSDEIGN